MTKTKTIHKIVYLLIIVCFILTTFSCEYDLDKENYSNVQPPDETHPFDLSLLSEQDTIIIFKNTDLTYNINTYGLKMIKGEFTLCGQTSNIYFQEGTFTINPNDYPPGYDTLALVIYTGSGTGSIADNFQTEGYKVVKKWLVLIDGRRALPITASKSITEDGYLKITWPKCDQYNFKSYEITSSAFNEKIIITDADSTVFIDSSYIGGPLSYRINLKVIESDYPEEWGNILVINDSIPSMKFIECGVDSVKITWNKSKYKCNYKLSRYSPDLILLNSPDLNNYVTVHAGFAAEASFNLAIEPYRLNSKNTGYIQNDFRTYIFGQFLTSNRPGSYGYNNLDKALYTNTYAELECYDINSISKINSVYINHLNYSAFHSCPTNSSKVAVYATGKIYIYPDKNLHNPDIISLNGNILDHFCLTDNNLIAIAYQNTYELVSIEEKKVITTLNIEDYPVYGKWACISTASDGKHASIATYNGIKLFSIENDIINNVYSDNRAYRSILFHPNFPNQLILTFNNNNILEIRNSFDFGLIKTVTLPTKAEILCNIDPLSGYLLLTDYTYLYVYDLNTSSVVFKIKCSSREEKPRLYGNRLFSIFGYTLNISKYLPE